MPITGTMFPWKTTSHLPILLLKGGLGEGYFIGKMNVMVLIILQGDTCFKNFSTKQHEWLVQNLNTVNKICLEKLHTWLKISYFLWNIMFSMGHYNAQYILSLQTMLTCGIIYFLYLLFDILEERSALHPGYILA